MSSVAGAAWPPQTPSKRMAGNIAVERVIRNLNSDYRLGVRIPDPSLSPTRRKELGEHDEHFARSDSICRGIQFLFYQRGDALDIVLDSFFNEAKAASLRWVPKPRADPSTIPSASAPPKARTADQQLGLQTILMSIIDTSVAQKKRSLLLPRLSGSAANAGLALVPSDESGACSPTSPTSPASIGSKRSFDGEYATPQDPKRPRGLLFASSSQSRSRSPTRGSVFADALDSVPSRQRLGRAPVDWSPRSRSQQQQEDVLSSSTESSGSVRTPSSLYSRRDGQRSTQNTMEADSWEQKPSSTRPAGPTIPSRPAGPTIPSPPLFNVAHRPTASQALVNNSPHRVASPVQRPASRSSRITPASSPIPGNLVASSQDLHNIPLQAWARHEALEAGGGRHQTALQQRLQDFWRKCPSLLCLRRHTCLTRAHSKIPALAQ